MIFGSLTINKPGFLRFKVTNATFRIGSLEPRDVGVDRTDGSIMIVINDEHFTQRGYTMWLKCALRKRQF